RRTPQPRQVFQVAQAVAHRALPGWADAGEPTLRREAADRADLQAQKAGCFISRNQTPVAVVHGHRAPSDAHGVLTTAIEAADGGDHLKRIVERVARCAVLPHPWDDRREQPAVPCVRATPHTRAVVAVAFGTPLHPTLVRTDAFFDRVLRHVGAAEVVYERVLLNLAQEHL